ncbi:hypothetical protein Dda_1437 [Drechslerella dactyloides]|uniref:EF-hand domain-containing protein n=1 Tax=Drechslerella dactyloides TaxID=74499 RepID=A0AAD6J211_DREDA|nr:hypothetical protein Dda_1437 [Drechslerella dactyloides]
MASQYPPHQAGRTGFQPTGDPTYQRLSDDHVVNIPLTPIESARSIAPSRAPSRADEKSFHAFNRPESTIDPLGLGEKTGGKRRLIKSGARGFNDGEEGTLTKLGQIYEKILNFSFITRWLIYIAPLALCLAVPIIVGATAAPEARIGGVRIVWIFAWAEIVWCSLWISKLAAKLLPIIFKTLIGVVSTGTRKYYMVIQQLEFSLTMVGWTFASWLSFEPMMKKQSNIAGKDSKLTFNPGTWEWIIRSILGACIVSALMILAKSILVQLISVQYHQKQFAARITANKGFIRILANLYECSRQMFPSYCPEFAEEDYILHAGLVNGLTSPVAKTHGSATPIRLLHQIGRVGDNITSAVGHVAKEITGKNVLNPNSSRSVVLDAMLRKTTIEALARRIWMSFVEEGKDTLYEEDFIEVMGHDRKDEAKAAFVMLDKDENGDISLDEMVTSLLEAARERKTLAKSMGDIDSAISALDSLLSTAAFIVIIFIFVAFLNRNFVTTLGTAGATLLSLSFVFAATAQEILGSCIFIFVKHPYDVGDRIDLDAKEYIVERISLLYTVFRLVESNKFVQVPNNILNGKSVENVSRSGPMREVVVFSINFDTSMRDITVLRSELIRFVDDNSRDFRNDTMTVEINSIKLDSLELKVEIRYKGNWADQPKRIERRNKFMSALVAALRKIPIYGPGAGDPSLGEAGNAQYVVSINSNDAARRKEDAAKAKEAKRYKSPEELELEHMANTAPTSSTMTGGILAAEAPIILTTSPSQTALNTQISDPRDETLLGDDASIISRAHSTRRADLDQVREIMRHQSTTGRRKRAGSTSTGGPYSPIVGPMYPGQGLAPSMSVRRPSASSPSPPPPLPHTFQSPLHQQSSPSPPVPHPGLQQPPHAAPPQAGPAPPRDPSSRV